MIQSLQVNIMVSYTNYVTNYNIYTWLEWLGGRKKKRKKRQQNNESIMIYTQIYVLSFTWAKKPRDAEILETPTGPKINRKRKERTLTSIATINWSLLASRPDSKNARPPTERLEEQNRHARQSAVPPPPTYHIHASLHPRTRPHTHTHTHTHTRMRWFSGNRRFGRETGDMNFTPLSRCVFIRCPQKHCNK